MESLCGLVFALLMIVPVASANCTDDQIQKYFTSSAPPWSNYHRISQAVYPPTQLPSLLIKIQVKFVNESSPTVYSTDACDLGPSEGDLNYTWSMSCLYVSGGYISLFTMRVFSLGTIWPERRQAELCVKLPQKCRRDLEKEGKMEHYLAKLQSVAVTPTEPDPSHNTVKCVTKGHGKDSCTGPFKAALCGVCWSLLIAAMYFAVLLQIIILNYLRDEAPTTGDVRKEMDKKKIAVERAAFATRTARTALDELKTLVPKSRVPTPTSKELNTPAEDMSPTSSTGEQFVNIRAESGVPTSSLEEVNMIAESIGLISLAENVNIHVTAVEEMVNAAVEAADEAIQTQESKKIAEVARKIEAAEKAATDVMTATEKAAIAKAIKVAATLVRAAKVAAAEATATKAVFAMIEAGKIWMLVFTVVDLGLTAAAFSFFNDDFCLILYIQPYLFGFIGLCCRQSYDVIVFPSVFIVIHHLLWIFLGILSEPFWAIPVFVIISSVSFSLFYLVYEVRKAYDIDWRIINILVKTSNISQNKYFNLFISFLCFCLVIFYVALVGQASYTDNFIATFAQSMLVFAITVWFKFVKTGQ